MRLTQSQEVLSTAMPTGSALPIVASQEVVRKLTSCARMTKTLAKDAPSMTTATQAAAISDSALLTSPAIINKWESQRHRSRKMKKMRLTQSQEVLSTATPTGSALPIVASQEVVRNLTSCARMTKTLAKDAPSMTTATQAAAISDSVLLTSPD